MSYSDEEHASIFSSFIITSIILSGIIYQNQLKKISNAIFSNNHPILPFPVNIRRNNFLSRTKLVLIVYYSILVSLLIYYFKQILSVDYWKLIRAFLPHIIIVWYQFYVCYIDIWKVIYVFMLYFLLCITRNVLFLVYTIITALAIFYNLIPNYFLKFRDTTTVQWKSMLNIFTYELICLFGMLIYMFVCHIGIISIVFELLFLIFNLFIGLSYLANVLYFVEISDWINIQLLIYCFIIEETTYSWINLDTHFNLVKITSMIIIFFDVFTKIMEQLFVFQYNKLVFLRLRKSVAIIGDTAPIYYIPATVMHKGKNYIVKYILYTSLNANGDLTFDHDSKITLILGLYFIHRINYVVLPPKLEILFTYISGANKILIDSSNNYFLNEESNLFVQKTPYKIILSSKYRSVKHVNIRETVQIIGEESFIYAKMSSVSIPASVFKIEKGAFFKCPNLKRVIIPKNSKLSYIEPHSFLNCYELERIYLPRSLEDIGHCSFRNCYKLEKIVFEDREKVKIHKTAFINIYFQAVFIDKTRNVTTYGYIAK